LKKKKEKGKRKRKRQTLVESGKWRNVEQLGQNTTNVSPKKAKEGWEGGQLTGQGGSESQIKSSRGKKKKKKKKIKKKKNKKK